jgi:hypothetical protein
MQPKNIQWFVFKEEWNPRLTAGADFEASGFEYIDLEPAA